MSFCCATSQSVSYWGEQWCRRYGTCRFPLREFIDDDVARARAVLHKHYVMCPPTSHNHTSMSASSRLITARNFLIPFYTWPRTSISRPMVVQIVQADYRTTSNGSASLPRIRNPSYIRRRRLQSATKTVSDSDGQRQANRLSWKECDAVWWCAWSCAWQPLVRHLA